MDSNFEIRPQVISIVDLLNTQNFSQEFHDINEEIGKTKESINTALVQIDNIEPNIKVDTNWIGTPKPKDIEKSISSVFNVIRPHIQKCGEAIRSTNNNLKETLSLIKLIAVAESTIYQQFDEQITSQNELKEKISDLCKQNGIRDEQVNELLESSFQRAYTLRDRINQVKLQVSIVNEKLSETSKIAKSTETKVGQLDEKVQEKIRLFDKHIKETKEADSKRDERLVGIDRYIAETKEADSKRDERLVGIDKYIAETKEADSKRDERLVGIDRYIAETKTEYQELWSSYLKMKRGNTILWFVIIGQFVLFLLFFVIFITNQTISTL